MMQQDSLWIDHKYVLLLSNSLRNFKKTGKAYNFSCPICGDSQKNSRKARGYFFEKGDKLIYHCHNCDVGATVKTFLERIDTALLQEYNMERYTQSKQSNIVTFKPQIDKFSSRRVDKFEPLKKLKKISTLPNDHKARKYVIDRKIPSDQHYKLYYASKFNAWVNTILPEKLNEKIDEGRLVIPFMDFDGYCFAAAGRSLKKDSSLRYITIKFDESKPKIFGLDTLDTTKRTYVVEGPIDSLFLPNCIAFAGSSGDLHALGLEDVVVIFDNEPRKAETISNYEKTIANNYKIFIWPEKYSEAKDVNDIVVKYMISGKKLLDMIDENVYGGLNAKIKLNQWKKI